MRACVRVCVCVCVCVARTAKREHLGLSFRSRASGSSASVPDSGINILSAHCKTWHSLPGYCLSMLQDQAKSAPIPSKHTTRPDSLPGYCLSILQDLAKSARILSPHSTIPGKVSPDTVSPQYNTWQSQPGYCLPTVQYLAKSARIHFCCECRNLSSWPNCNSCQALPPKVCRL